MVVTFYQFLYSWTGNFWTLLHISQHAQ